jgi:hypothetical protein
MARRLKDPKHSATVWYRGEKRAGESEWIEGSFPRSDTLGEELKGKWDSYWVYLLRPYRVLSKDGGTYLRISNNSYSFFWLPRDSISIVKGTSPVG